MADSKSFEWYTPGFIFEALGLRFDLDPCSPGPGKSFVPADHHYSLPQDGLALPWEGVVWCNPPYGPVSTGVWLRKLAAHGTGIGLVPATMETRASQAAIAQADMICFIPRRIKFFKGSLTTPGGSPPTGSMLVAFGPKCAAAVRASGLGACMTPDRP